MALIQLMPFELVDLVLGVGLDMSPEEMLAALKIAAELECTCHVFRRLPAYCWHKNVKEVWTRRGGFDMLATLNIQNEEKDYPRIKKQAAYISRYTHSEEPRRHGDVSFVKDRFHPDRRHDIFYNIMYALFARDTDNRDLDDEGEGEEGEEEQHVKEQHVVTTFLEAVESDPLCLFLTSAYLRVPRFDKVFINARFLTGDSGVTKPISRFHKLKELSKNALLMTQYCGGVTELTWQLVDYDAPRPANLLGFIRALFHTPPRSGQLHQSPFCGIIDHLKKHILETDRCWKIAYEAEWEWYATHTGLSSIELKEAATVTCRTGPWTLDADEENPRPRDDQKYAPFWRIIFSNCSESAKCEELKNMSECAAKYGRYEYKSLSWKFDPDRRE